MRKSVHSTTFSLGGQRLAQIPHPCRILTGDWAHPSTSLPHRLARSACTSRVLLGYLCVVPVCQVSSHRIESTPSTASAWQGPIPQTWPMPKPHGRTAPTGGPHPLVLSCSLRVSCFIAMRDPTCRSSSPNRTELRMDHERDLHNHPSRLTSPKSYKTKPS